MLEVDLALIRHGALIVDAIAVFVVLEAFVLLVYRRTTGRGPGARVLLPNLAAGLGLLLALSAALHGAWVWIAPALAAAGIAHALDLRARWRAAHSAR